MTDKTTATFSVKNLDRFQHYKIKDRQPVWIKLYMSLLMDYNFARLDDAAKAHLIGIWLLASCSGNRLPLDPEWVGVRTNSTQPVDLNALISAGFLVVDQGVKDNSIKSLEKSYPRREENRREKNKNREGADAPAFEGRYILGVTEATLDEWLRAFPTFSRESMLAELHCCDCYYMALDKPPTGKWFFKAASWLKRGHVRTMEEKDDMVTLPNGSKASKAEAKALRGIL